MLAADVALGNRDAAQMGTGLAVLQLGCRSRHGLSAKGTLLQPAQQIPSHRNETLALARPSAPALQTLHLNERAPWARLTIVAATLVAFAAAWRYTPLSALTNAELIARWAEEFASRPWAPFALLATYTPASIVLFPRPLVTLFAVVAFGPWLGFTYAFGGILLAALATYALGAKLDHVKVRRIAGRRLNQLVDVLHRRGLVAITAVRLVPIAPFAVVNLVAGAVRIRLKDFIGGSAIGIVPGTFVATVFGDQLAAGLRDPRSINLWLIAGACLVLFVGTWAVRRWLFRAESHSDEPSAPQA